MISHFSGLLPSLAICSVALLAGFIQGLSGFGSVLVALPILVLFLDFDLAVPLASIWGMTINTILLLQLRAHLRLKNILPLTLAAIPGIPLGVYILVNANTRLLEMLLGVLLLVFSLYFIWSGGKTRNLSSRLVVSRRLLFRLPGGQPGHERPTGYRLHRLAALGQRRNEIDSDRLLFPFRSDHYRRPGHERPDDRRSLHRQRDFAFLLLFWGLLQDHSFTGGWRRTATGRWWWA